MIPGVVLAAGLSTRMGRLKATLPLAADETFLSRIVGTLTAAGVSDVVVVVGHEADAVTRAIEDRRLPVRIVFNPAYREGQFSSLLAAIVSSARSGLTSCRFHLDNRGKA